jgi:Flp pilus assembly protein CpaB
MNYTLRNLLVATVLMMAGIVLVTSFIRGERRDLSRGKQEVTVFVAAKEIPAGTAAADLESGGFVESRDMLREDVPPQAIGSISSIDTLVSNEDIHQGEPVTSVAFDRSSALKPANSIKGNERLLTLPIPAANDIGGQIRVGDHVDLSASVTQDKGGETVKLRVFLGRNIEVIDTPQSLTPAGVETKAEAPEAEGDSKLYVIKATDEEAAHILWGLSAADEHGVSMLLRGANGDTDTSVPPITAIWPDAR